MKTKFFSFISLLIFSACETKPVEIKYCDSCKVNTEDVLILNDQPGWIIYLSDYDKYAIEVAHYNEPVVYIPCEMPAYFHPKEMASVVFCGSTIQNTYNSGSPIRTHYTCIKLDTIFLKTAR